MKTETKNRIRVAGRILFLIYLLALVYFLFFAEWYGRRNLAAEDYRYNLVLFREIRRFWLYRHRVGYLAAALNLAGNVVGFVPFGFILPVMHARFAKGYLAAILGFGLSLSVETVQLVTRVGCFDVDDLLLNTIGAVIGYGLFRICDGIRRRRYGEKTV